MSPYMQLYKIYCELLTDLGNIHYPMPENDPSAYCLECNAKYPCEQVKIMFNSMMEMDKVHGIPC